MGYIFEFDILTFGVYSRTFLKLRTLDIVWEETKIRDNHLDFNCFKYLRAVDLIGNLIKFRII